MADKIKIRITIANRVYPLTIHSPSEEEGMRKAAKKINDLVTRFEQDYAVGDKQNALAMCALQFASELEINEINSDDTVKQATERLTKLHELLAERLN